MWYIILYVQHVEPYIHWGNGMNIVNDQSTVLNLNTSLSVNTEISRENKELTCNYRKESNKEQCSVSNIDPGISDESNKEGSSPYVPVRQSNQCDNYNNIDLESSMPGKTNKVKSSSQVMNRKQFQTKSMLLY